MVALIYHQVAVRSDTVMHDTFPYQTLNEGHVDTAGEGFPATSEPANGLGRHIEKPGQTFHPLFQQLLAVHENQAVDAAARDKPGSKNGFAKSRSGGQDPGIVSRHGVRRQLLFRPQLTVEAHVEWRPTKSFIAQRRLDAQRGEQGLRLPQAASGQCQVLRPVLRAMDNTRLAESGQPHCLRPVEFRILERSQSHQTVPQPRGKLLLGNVDLIAEHQFECLGQRPRDRRFLPPTRGRSSPREIILLFLESQAYADDAPAAFGLTGQGLRLCAHDLPHGGKKRPLVLIWLELLVQENAIARCPGLLLQRQCDKIAEAAFGQGVMIGKKPVIRRQADFRAAFHGFSEKIRAHIPRHAGGNGLGEEEPKVAALARAGAFQSDRQRQPLAGLPQRPGVLLPGVAIEIDGNQITGFVREHGIQTHDEFAT